MGCGASDPEAPEVPAASVDAPTAPPIVLVSIDTLRSDRLPVYGYDGVETPAIDSLVADGVVYERAYAHVPLTLPSHASMLTGLLPPEHGVRGNIGYRFESEGVPYLPRELQDAGYATAASVSAHVLRAEGGLGEGFDLYDDELGPRGRRGAGGVQRPGSVTLEAVEPWLAERSPGEPFFLFLHLFEPHTPYAPPPPYDRYADPYDGEIATADAVVGRLLDQLRAQGLYDQTLVLLTSDHGEGLGDHGEDEHGVLLYREALQVPLVVKWPGADGAGTRVATPVQLADVAPTLKQAAGLVVDAGIAGRPLPKTDDEVSGPPRTIYAETLFPRFHFGWSELTSLIEGPHHYIHGPDPELYHLLDDPAETQNRLREDREVTRRLRDRVGELARPAEAPAAVGEEERRALAALGYVQTSDAAFAEGPLPDPKTQLASVASLRECLRAYGAGDLSLAEPACRRASEEHPNSLDAWEHLGRTLQERGDRSAALDALGRALDLASGRASHLAVASALLWIESGAPDRALELLDRETVRTEAAGPGAGSPRALRLLATRTLAQLGRLDEARRRADVLAAEHPDDADALYLRGTVRLGQRDFEGAEVDLRRALELAANHTAALSDLAMLMAHQGRTGEARELFRRVLELRPGDPLASQGLRRLGG